MGERCGYLATSHGNFGSAPIRGILGVVTLSRFDRAYDYTSVNYSDQGCSYKPLCSSGINMNTRNKERGSTSDYSPRRDRPARSSIYARGS